MTDYNLYFAFGSNMSADRLIERCPSALTLREIGRLHDYKLVFNRKGDYNNGGVASIEPDKGSSIFGVLYALSKKDFERLDGFENPNQEAYIRTTITVTNAIGQDVDCFTYIAIPQGDFKPTSQYLSYIINGAIEMNFPADYIRKLKEIETLD